VQSGHEGFGTQQYLNNQQPTDPPNESVQN